MKDENHNQYSIQELSDQFAINRRTIRFYIQRSLLSPPEGKGRGTFYTDEHVNQLKEISRLQTLGLSLDAIDKVLKGQSSEQDELSDIKPVSRGQRSFKPIAISQWRGSMNLQP